MLRPRNNPNHTLSISYRKNRKMDAIKMLAIALIVAGGLGLAYGGFTYTKETHETKIGPIVLAVKDTQTVNIPIWLGIGSLVVGIVLLVTRKQ